MALDALFDAHLHLRHEQVREFFFHAADVCRLGGAAGFLPRQLEVCSQALDQAFGLAHRQFLAADLVGCRDLRAALQREQRTCVPHFDVASQQHGLHGICQVQQTQQIAGGAAAAAHGLRSLLMREAEFVDQALQALRFFQRIQIFALHVLDQRHGCRGMVIHIAHQHRHFAQTCQMGCAKAPLARNDFVLARVVAAGEFAHQNGLHDALRLDAFCQLVQRTLIHARAWLVLPGHHVAEQQLGWRAVRAGCVCGACGAGAEQGLQPATQTFFSGCHGDVCPFQQSIVFVVGMYGVS